MAGNGSGKVVVACKWPSGLELRVYNYIEVDEDYPGGTRKIRRAMQRGDAVHLNGYLKPNKGKIQQPAQQAFYELTHSIDEDFMKAWWQQNKDSDLVKNEIVMFGSIDEIKSRIRTNELRRCGVEPLDPANLPSVVRAISTFQKRA